MKKENSIEAPIDPKEQRIQFLSRWVSDFHNITNGVSDPPRGYLPGIKAGPSMRELVNRLEDKPGTVDISKAIEIIYSKSFGPVKNMYKNTDGVFTCKGLFWTLLHNEMINMSDDYKITLGKRVYEESTKPYRFLTMAWD